MLIDDYAQCEGILKKDKTRCPVRAKPDSRFCGHHDPDRSRSYHALPDIKPGARIYYLTVKGLGPNRKSGEVTWRCECECGVRRNLSVKQLHGGWIKCCGKCRPGINLRRGAAGDVSWNTLINRYRNDSRRRWKKVSTRSFAWLLSREQAIQLFQSNCAYCGVVPDRKYNAYGYKLRSRTNGGSGMSRSWMLSAEVIYNGIDRIDSSKDYEIGNVVTCCKTCNFAKGDLTQEEFTGWIDRLVAFRHEQKIKHLEEATPLGRPQTPGHPGTPTPLGRP